MFFIWIPILALLSNYDQVTCLIHVGTEGTLNEKKTSIRNACGEHFDFLGYTFGPHYSKRTGRKYIGYSPSNQSVAKIKAKVGDLLVPSNVRPWAEVCERLNQTLDGWRAYFGRGSTAKAYRAVDEHVYDVKSG